MLLGLPALVRVDELRHVKLPRLRAALVDDLPEHVIQVIHRIDHAADIRFLVGDDAWVVHAVQRRIRRLITARVGHIHAVDVVGGIERMHRPGVEAAGVDRQTPALEEHHRRVDAPLAGRDQALTHAGEVRLVPGGQIELWQTIGGDARSRARPWQRIEDDALIGPTRALWLLEHPQAHEVVVICLHEVEVLVIREGRIAGPADILQVCPGVRASQVDGGPAIIGEIASVGGMGPQRACEVCGCAGWVSGLHSSPRGCVRLLR